MKCPQASGTDIPTAILLPGLRTSISGERQPIDDATRQRIDNLLLERQTLAAITHVSRMSQRWGQLYVNQTFYERQEPLKLPKQQLD